MKGQTNAKLASKGIQGESVNIMLLTNQESHSDLIGAVITVSYGGVDTEYVWEGSEVTVRIPAMMDYSISVSEVEGYTTPEGFSATSQMGYSRKLEMTYNTELVRVTLSADDSSSVNGQIVTINGEAFTYSGTAVTKKVPFGTEYSVSVNEKAGYITPATQTLTASKSVRDLELKYQVPIGGVYIVDNNGELHEVSSWTGGSDCTGVYLGTDNVNIIIAPTGWRSYINEETGNATSEWNGNKNSAWGGYGTESDNLPPYITDESSASADYNGEENTDKIIAALSGTVDGQSAYYLGAPAAEYCRAYSKGCKGVGEWYLPALGEYADIMLNWEAVNTALEKIGNRFLVYYSDKSEWRWSSTNYSNVYAWLDATKKNYFGDLLRSRYAKDKNGGFHVRPIAKYYKK